MASKTSTAKTTRQSSSPTDIDIRSPVDMHTAGQVMLWQLGITELVGHNLEKAGRKSVNKLLKESWIVLHIYTLRYREGDIWREKPMVILGKRYA